METLLWILHVIVAVSLVVVILMQPGQAGGMGTAFGGGGSQTVFGSQGSSGFLGKLTAALGTLFFLTSLGLAMLAKTGEESLLEGGEQPAQEQQQEVPVAPGEGPQGPPIPGTGGQQR
ncbi:preprotein translocase subunit SecG [Thiohalorhabdus sp.]|uniref:preprotein translocase subunit SecG n=1 Tax=Thiohalorhabdus sp. TaxID=3094134 RepID=UPI002FC290F6